MSNYPSGNAPPYQPNPNLPANPTDTKGADGPAGGDTIRLVQPTTSFPSSPAQSGGSDSMPAAEANYWKSRQDAYADPYDTPDQAPTDGQGQGYGQSPYQVPAGANSEPTIGPWDSASQRSNSVRTTGAGAYGRTGVAGASAPGGMAAGAGGLSGIDEERGYGNPGYGGQRQSQYGYTNMGPGGKDDPYAQAEEYEMRGLVSNAAAMGRTLDNTRGAYGAGGGRTDSYGDPTSNGKYPINTSDSPYAWPPLDNVSGAPHLVKESALTSVLLFPTGLDRLLALVGMNKGSFPIEQQIERKRHGVPGQRFPVATWVLTAVMTGVMIYELIRNNALTGSVIATKPTFNYMIGPSSSVLINIGARFPPCMKLVEAVPPTFNFACISDLNNPPTTVCPIAEICGHGLTTTGTPDQWWRFIVPIFLHVGVVHLLVNMVAQMLIGAQIEKEIGTLPYLIVYFAGGVYGFLLGGNFGRVGVPSAGASGALFAVNACVAVDLALHWKYEERPVLKAFFVFIEFCIGIAIGYIPNAVDGLAHLGGFAMGILLGTILYPSISETKAHRYTLWAARVVALVLVIVAFALTTKNFLVSILVVLPDFIERLLQRHRTDPNDGVDHEALDGVVDVVDVVDD